MELMSDQLVNSDFWQGKNVLLTGHTGFKGSWLGLWLSELGANVTGVSLENNTKPNLFGQLQLRDRLKDHYIADIRDLSTLTKIVESSQPAVVLHLAAQPLVRQATRVGCVVQWRATLIEIVLFHGRDITMQPCLCFCEVQSCSRVRRSAPCSSGPQIRPETIRSFEFWP